MKLPSSNPLNVRTLHENYALKFDFLNLYVKVLITKPPMKLKENTLRSTFYRLTSAALILLLGLMPPVSFAETAPTQNQILTQPVKSISETQMTADTSEIPTDSSLPPSPLSAATVSFTTSGSSDASGRQDVKVVVKDNEATATLDNQVGTGKLDIATNSVTMDIKPIYYYVSSEKWTFQFDSNNRLISFVRDWVHTMNGKQSYTYFMGEGGLLKTSIVKGIGWSAKTDYTYVQTTAGIKNDSAYSITELKYISSGVNYLASWITKNYNSFDSAGNLLVSLTAKKNSVFKLNSDGTANLSAEQALYSDSYVQYDRSLKQISKGSVNSSKTLSAPFSQIKSAADYKLIESVVPTKTISYYSDIYLRTLLYNIQYLKESSGLWAPKLWSTTPQMANMIQSLPDIQSTEKNDIQIKTQQQITTPNGSVWTVAYGEIYRYETPPGSYPGYNRSVATYLGYGLSFSRWVTNPTTKVTTQETQIVNFPTEKTVTLDGTKWEIQINLGIVSLKPITETPLTPPVVKITSSVLKLTNKPLLDVKYTVDGGAEQVKNFALAEGENKLFIEAKNISGLSSRIDFSVTLDTVPPAIKLVSSVPKLTKNPILLIDYAVDGKGTSQTFNLKEGLNGIILKAVDEAGNESNMALSVELDTTPPSINVVSVVPEATNNPVLVITYNIDYKEPFTLAATTVTRSFDLTEGSNSVVLTAVDRIGNETKKEIVVILDTKAPVIQPVNPIPQMVRDSSLIVLYKVTDLFNGMISTEEKTANFDLVLGINNLKLEAVDKAGNKTVYAFSVNYERSELPVIQITSSVPTLTNKSSLEVKYMVDGGSELSKIFALAEGENNLFVEATNDAGTSKIDFKVTLDTVAPAIVVTSSVPAITKVPTLVINYTVDGKAMSQTSNLVEGSNTITLKAVDEAGNQSIKDLVVKLDTVPPVVVLGVYPALTNKAGVVIPYTVDGIAKTLNVTLSEGVNKIPITEKDEAGNETKLEAQITLDTVPPVIKLTNPLPTYTGDASITIDYTVDGLPKIETFALPIEGENVLVLYAKDLAGNEATLNLKVNKVTSGMKLLDTIPALTNQTSLSVNYLIDGEERAKVFALDKGDGVYDLVLTDTGKLGKPYSIVIKTTLDTTPAVISNHDPSDITDKKATITWTTNEVSDSQVEFGTTTAYGSVILLNTSMVTAHSMQLNALAAATTYHFRVKSRDVAGNLTTTGDFTFKTANQIEPPTKPVITLEIFPKITGLVDGKLSHRVGTNFPGVAASGAYNPGRYAVSLVFLASRTGDADPTARGITYTIDWTQPDGTKGIPENATFDNWGIGDFYFLSSSKHVGVHKIRVYAESGDAIVHTDLELTILPPTSADRDTVIPDANAPIKAFYWGSNAPFAPGGGAINLKDLASSCGTSPSSICDTLENFQKYPANRSIFGTYPGGSGGSFNANDFGIQFIGPVGTPRTASYTRSLDGTPMMLSLEQFARGVRGNAYQYWNSQSPSFGSEGSWRLPAFSRYVTDVNPVIGAGEGRYNAIGVFQDTFFRVFAQLSPEMQRRIIALGQYVPTYRAALAYAMKDAPEGEFITNGKAHPTVHKPLSAYEIDFARLDAYVKMINDTKNILPLVTLKDITPKDDEFGFKEPLEIVNDTEQVIARTWEGYNRKTGMDRVRHMRVDARQSIAKDGDKIKMIHWNILETGGGDNVTITCLNDQCSVADLTILYPQGNQPIKIGVFAEEDRPDLPMAM